MKLLEKTAWRTLQLSVWMGALALPAFLPRAAIAATPEPMILDSGWQLQDSATVSGTGADLSQPGFQPQGWHAATVPGTVLTSLVNDGVYPEPLYGENNRPDKIPDSLCRTSYWYQTVFTVPAEYSGKKVWLNFDGINYTAEVWVNGKDLGAIKGAFSRGILISRML